MANGGGAALRFAGVRAGYGGAERLHGVSCEVRAGRLTALIGPNGCGKSTLLKCAAGLLKPSGGAVYVGGMDVASLSPKALASRVSYMPQSRLTPSIPVEQLVAHGRYPHLRWGRSLTEADREIVRAALARAGAQDCANRLVSELSGGERQRAYLAMMLAQQAPAMLLDEPTTYLDPGAQFQLMDLLSALCGEGRAVAVVLHDLALALEYADDVLLMRDGRIEETGAPDDLCASGAIQDAFGVEIERTSAGRYALAPARGRGNPPRVRELNSRAANGAQ